MNGNGPGKFQGILEKGADFFFRNLTGLFIGRVFDIFPADRFYLDFRLPVATADPDTFVADGGDRSDLAVIKTFFLGQVIADKHDLGALFQDQPVRSRVGVFGEIAFNLGCEAMGCRGDFLQPGPVDGIGLAVMTTQGDIARIVVIRFAAGTTARIERVQGLLVKVVVTDPVEEFDEPVVRLAIDMLQFNGHQFGLGQGMTAEKIGSGIVPAKKIPFIILDHRGQLVQVSDHQQLHAAERQRAAPEPAQHRVNPVEQVRPDHADLVDNQQVQAEHDILFFPAEPILPVAAGMLAARDQGAKGHLEKRMQGNPAHVNGSYSGGCSDNHPFGGSAL